VLEESAAEGVNVGIGIFDFTESAQNSWDSLKAKVCQVADVVVFDISLGE